MKHVTDLACTGTVDIYDFPPEGEQPTAPLRPNRLNLSKPVIANVSGTAVVGGMELAFWADIRVMEKSVYMGVYCRCWGIPLIVEGPVRLRRLVGEGRAMDLVLTGVKVDVEDALQIGLRDYVVSDGRGREEAEDLANSLLQFPKSCMKADHWSVRNQHGL